MKLFRVKKKSRSFQKAEHPSKLSTKSVVVKFGLEMYYRLFTNSEIAIDVIHEVTNPSLTALTLQERLAFRIGSVQVDSSQKK